MPMIKSRDPPLLHAGVARGLVTLSGSVEHRSPQIQLNVGAHKEKISSRSKNIIPTEAIVDIDISVEAVTVCDNVYSNATFDTLSDSSSDSSTQNDTSTNVKNRLSENIEFWQESGAGPWVIKGLEQG